MKRLFVLFAAFAAGLPAQTFDTIATFNYSNGDKPAGPLIQGADGNFYGTAELGGAFGRGEVFSVSRAGVISVFYSTNLPTAAYPSWGVTLGSDGNFYATSTLQDNHGSIFSLTPTGAFTSLYRFSAVRSGPTGLVQAQDGNFYGATLLGGAGGAGTLFRITPSGVFADLHDFTGADGSSPQAALVLGSNGALYGTTAAGGTFGAGTIFRLTPGGEFKTVYSFCPAAGCTDGKGPGGLVAANDGSLWGVTYAGGANGSGTVFHLSTSGTLSTVYSFCPQPGCADGSGPQVPVVAASDGNFYGLTSRGGANGLGSLFQLTPQGVLTNLHDLEGSIFNFNSGLLQATDGNFYGVEVINDGIVYRLSMGLAPFVRPVPGYGAPGTAITILGTNLTGATSVSFHGVAAAFTIVSPTAISATVPAGATAGKIRVVTPAGTLTSDVNFRVLP